MPNNVSSTMIEKIHFYPSLETLLKTSDKKSDMEQWLSFRKFLVKRCRNGCKRCYCIAYWFTEKVKQSLRHKVTAIESVKNFHPISKPYCEECEYFEEILF